MRRTHKPRGHGVRSTRPPVGVVEHIWSTRDWNRKRQSWEIRWHCKVRWLRSFAHFSAGWIDTRSTILAASLRLATIDEVQVATR